MGQFFNTGIFIVQILHQHTTTGKTITFTIRIFFGKVMSLLFNVLSRLVIPFLPRSKCLLISWLQSLSAVILELKKMKPLTVFTLSPSIFHKIMGLEAMIFIFWMLSFEPAFSLSSFTFIKRLVNSSSLSTIKVVSSAYLRLLIFLPTVLIPVCESSSPVFPMIYSGHKLNNQGGNIQPWSIPFPVWNQSIVPSPLVTVDSCTAYRFLRRQVRWSSTPISLRVFHSLLWSMQSDFSIVNEADVDFVVIVVVSIPLLFWWSSGCWPFDLWPLCLF